MRNYKKETERQKEKYARIQTQIDKDYAVKLKTYLNQNSMTMTAWLRQKIDELEIDENK